MQDGALDDALKTERRLRVDILRAIDRRCVFDDELAQIAAQLIDIAAARAQGFGGRWIVEQGQQQVFDGNKFVALLPCFDKSHVQADFQFLRNHFQFSSITHASGCWLSRAKVATCSTLVAATSRA